MAEASTRVRIGCMVTGNVPASRGVGEEGGHRRSSVRRPARVRDRSRLAKVEHAMLGLEFGTADERVARFGRGVSDDRGALDEGSGRLRRGALCASTGEREPEADPEALPADLDRRNRRAQDTPRRGRARRRVELLRARGRGGAAAPGRPRHPLRRGRAGPGSGAPLAPARVRPRPPRALWAAATRAPGSPSSSSTSPRATPSATAPQPPSCFRSSASWGSSFG